MPTSSSAASIEKKRPSRLPTQVKSIERHDHSDAFLTIESALPPHEHKKLSKRSHSTLNAASLNRAQGRGLLADPITLHALPDGSTHVERTQKDKDTHPDRISLDRRGLSSFPLIKGEFKLRLLSLQHNLITNLEGINMQNFPYLVFLDIYDNQLEKMVGLENLTNLRVLLLGKNRIKKIEGLSTLTQIEVLDLHGNQITQISGLNGLSELKVLNLAGNQLRYVGTSDFQGLGTLQELNLRRNRLKKLMGFGQTLNLTKLFISNNDLQSVEDISSLAKASSLREISIDNNPVFLSGDCVSFLVSYLPHLSKLNTTLITDQVRKAAMAWRRNKESTNTAFMDLTSDVCLNVRREEIISNARTNWELLRSQTKCLRAKSNLSQNANFSADSDLILTSFGHQRQHTKTSITKVPLINKKLIRTSSQETDNSQNTTSSSSSEFIRLPPILVPIIKKMAQKKSASLSSIGPNVDSSVSSLASETTEPISSSDTEVELEEDKVEKIDESSNVSVSTNVTASTSSSEPTSKMRSVKSAVNARVMAPLKWQSRATTAKQKKAVSPPAQASKDREQGGDYLIEICGRYLNVYGQCALRFIDKAWNVSKSNDVHTVKFHYVNFNGIGAILNKIKLRFPNIEHFQFKETNIQFLGQLNALAEVQGLVSLLIDPDGNPIVKKNWRSYAIYRLSHWGLRVINNVEVGEEEVKQANEEYGGLSDLVLWSLPDVLLQPLLVRLRLDVSYGITEKNAKKWLLTADPDLRSVVSKEALQWKKGAPVPQEDVVMRQKAKIYISNLLDEMSNSVKKLRLLEEKWPLFLHEFVKNTLVDYSQLDMYMKEKMLELKL